MPGLRPENIVADDAPADAGEVRPDGAVVEVVPVNEEVVTGAAAALAGSGIGVAQRVVERDPGIGAGGGRIGVDLKIA